MKNIDDILTRFELVPELDVSAEDLGAYIEGNLSPEEALQIEQVMDESPEMGYLLTVATDPEPEIADDLTLDELPEFPTFAEVSADNAAAILEPEVEVVADDEVEVAAIADDDDYQITEFTDPESDPLHVVADFNHDIATDPADDLLDSDFLAFD